MAQLVHPTCNLSSLPEAKKERGSFRGFRPNCEFTNTPPPSNILINEIQHDFDIISLPMADIPNPIPSALLASSMRNEVDYDTGSGSRAAIDEHRIVDSLFKKAGAEVVPPHGATSHVVPPHGAGPLSNNLSRNGNVVIPALSKIWGNAHIDEVWVPDAIQEAFRRLIRESHPDATVLAVLERLETSVWMRYPYNKPNYNTIRSAVAFHQGLLALTARLRSSSSEILGKVEEMRSRNIDTLSKFSEKLGVQNALRSLPGSSELVLNQISPKYATLDGIMKNVQFDSELSKIASKIHRLAIYDSARLARDLAEPRQVSMLFKQSMFLLRARSITDKLVDMASPQASTSVQTKTAALALLHAAAHWSGKKSASRLSTDKSPMFELKDSAASALRHMFAAQGDDAVLPVHRVVFNDLPALAPITS
ncbi:hypothetical protein KEM48_012489 [Puccinia striiformis f. sp. tritici PST-130]|nr:hypothetical protein KEM48_012489 [Puccinia striiformis f. sp. tritici PST-130]